MCYNCGCGLPDEDHGHPHWITNETFDKAKAMGETKDDVKRNVMKALEKELDSDLTEEEISNPDLAKIN